MREKEKLSLHIDTQKQQSDEILSPSEMSPQLVLTVPTADPELKNAYSSLDENFHKEMTGYHRQFCLREISRKASRAMSWHYEKAYRLMNEIANFFHLNTFEVVYWSYLLEHNRCTYFRPVLSSYFTAFQTKCDLNQELAPYEHLLCIKIPSFKYLFHNWQLVCENEREPTLKEVNDKFTALMLKACRGKNYQKIVDTLIEIPKKKEKGSFGDTENAMSIIMLDEELTSFQSDLLKGEKLSPIEKYANS
ncbi:hypothetical protein SteCoe_6516 [Stentor coeruleus]|uniref:Uncharacterized protein n=1 Tax=Stentor coeruleus TaxID=5963 RepID=A0A1R2CPW4_9CILI|nr:hypothetical protein SteCoe_6516 [Stentor coeruleus]